jgi:hypothetical protein
MTEKWGPDFWGFFHHVSINYPSNPSQTDKEKICNLIKSIPYILPCEKCSIHFKENLNKFPIDDVDLSSKNNFVTWFVDFHNTVNKMLKKKIFTRIEAQNTIDSIPKINYMIRFKKVMDHIDGEIKHNISFSKCKEILNFIDASLYFSGQEFKDIDINKLNFLNKDGFRKLKREIFSSN